MLNEQWINSSRDKAEIEGTTVENCLIFTGGGTEFSKILYIAIIEIVRELFIVIVLLIICFEITKSLSEVQIFESI